MSFITQTRQEMAESLYVLSKTRKIEKQDLDLPEWKLLLDEYQEHERSPWADKAMISLLNSIFFQKAPFFILTKRSAGQLLRNDKNWKKSVGLKNSNYKKLLHEAVSRKLIKLEAKVNRVWVYKVIHPVILSMLVVDMHGRRDAVIAYAKKASISGDLAEGTDEGTAKGTKS